MTTGFNALICLLSRALDETRCTPPQQTLTIHLAERNGVTIAAAVYDETRVSSEWRAA